MCHEEYNILVSFFTDVTDILGDTNFLLKFENGYKFASSNDVKANFAESAVVYLESHLKFE